MGEAWPVRLRFTPRALAELDEVLAYIVERSPEGARRVQTRIKVLSDLLLQHPNAGQRTSLKGLRRIATTPYPYLIYYELTAEDLLRTDRRRDHCYRSAPCGS